MVLKKREGLRLCDQSNYLIERKYFYFCQTKWLNNIEINLLDYFLF